MITVVGVWEPGYSYDQMFLEDTIWKQTLSAFAVDRFVMVSPDVKVPVTNPEQSDSMEEALATCDGVKVFMVFDVGGVDWEPLYEFHHPVDATYIFGCPGENLKRYITQEDRAVHIPTPNKVDMLACSCVSAVLYDRLLKCQSTV